MEIVRLSGIALLTALLSLFLRQQKSPLSLAVSLSGGCLLLFCAAPYLRDVLGALGQLAADTGLDRTYLGALVRILATTFLTESTAALCRDAGEEALSKKLELAGKLVILGMAMPIITALFETVLSCLPA